MAITKATLLLFSVIALFAVAITDAAAPAPAADCSTVVLGMADCLSYVTNGSTEQKPQGTCCSGLKKVLKTNPDCLCEAFKNSAQLGLTLNLTKALALPTACHASSSSVPKCGDNAPVPAPDAAVSPGTPTISPSASEDSSTPGGSGKVAPAPAPGSSGSTVLAASLVSILFALVASALSSF